MRQIPLVFPCQGDRLVGVISAPEVDTDTALIVIVGGPQYRVGSHRQYLQLARHVASCGFAALRFDARGMGDAEGAQRSFEDIGDDVAAAIDAMQQALPSVKRVGLWGLCGGATAALLYCRERRDPRVAGVALINPWVRSEETQARTRVKHYYGQRLLQAAFWKKLFSGGVAIAAVGELWRALRIALSSPRVAGTPDGSAATLERRMAEGLVAFGGDTLLVLSENDYTAKEFLETVRLDRVWQAQLARRTVTRVDVDGADHTFSQPFAQAQVELETSRWLGRLRDQSAGRQGPVDAG
ncbi:MAG: hydrolase 1, exosortase A system-associated [Rubrivivax sp.]|nr:hydrolase 1, exosortase A system-associated [Rubrivivax sp.]